MRPGEVRVIQAGDGRLIDAIAAGLSEVGPEITVRRTTLPPIVGAALLGLDELGASCAAQQRVREEFAAAVGPAEGGE